MATFDVVRYSRAPAAGLAAVGVLWGGMAASWPDIKAAVMASDAELGFAQLMSAVGGLIAMAMAPRIGRLLGRWAMPVIATILATAFFFPLMAWNVPTLALALFALGLSVAALDILTNVEISARESKYGLHLMGFNHAMFSFAFAGSAYAAALARQAGYGPADIFPFLSAACLLLAAMTYLRESAQSDDDTEDTETTRTPPWFAVFLTGGILCASFIGENATEAWSALHIERTLEAPAGHGGLGPAVLGLVMGFGRLFGQVVSERLGHARLIFWSAVLGIFGALIIAAAPTPGVVLLGVAVTAIGMAIIVPSAMSILGARVSDKARALALSRAWMLGIVGFFIGPAMMGGISELVGLRMSFVAVALIVATILPAILMLDRKG